MAGLRATRQPGVDGLVRCWRGGLGPAYQLLEREGAPEASGCSRATSRRARGPCRRSGRPGRAPGREPATSVSVQVDAVVVMQHVDAVALAGTPWLAKPAECTCAAMPRVSSRCRSRPRPSVSDRCCRCRGRGSRWASDYRRVRDRRPLDPWTPVLVGVGQVVHRDRAPRPLEPVDLMAEAARLAADDVRRRPPLLGGSTRCG